MQTTVIKYQSYFENGISYEQYKKNFQEEIALGDKSDFAAYLPQNWQRQSRLDRKLKLTDGLMDVISKLEAPLNWLLITEHWCGDASQINPIFNKVAEQSKSKIELKIVYRDENLDLIDAHLTNGRSRSIPILIQLDTDFQLIDSYGPRPEEAQKIAMTFLEKGEDYNIPLHTWYARDKQKSVQADLELLLKQARLTLRPS